MTVDLDVLSDAMLDKELARLFDDYATAKTAGDINEARTIHLRIEDVLDVQHRRLDAWLAERACVTEGT